MSVPQEPRWAPDTAPAERQLWRWAVEQLAGDVLVLPQVAMTVSSGGRPQEAEADLVLVDPSAGVTVVEVKGGTVSYDGRHARWLQNGHDLRDPVGQAKRARSVLRTALSNAGVTVPKVALRWAVAVPECRLDAPGEPVLDERELWDALAVDQLDLLYRRTVGSLELGEEPLGEDTARFVAEVLRGRTRHGRPSLVAQVDEHEEQVRIHTESHRNVMRQFAAHPHVLVRGAAGTGKTVLAIRMAADLASYGQRVLLACWNIVLARWLRESLRRELESMGSPATAEVTDDPMGEVVVSDLASLAEHGVDEVPEGLSDEDRYYEVYPQALAPSVTGGEFDAIVLDEAQDLSEWWVLAVASLVTRDGRWYAFTDRHQDLFHNDPALPDFLEVEHELRENFRNSEAIAAFASQFGPVEVDCLTGTGTPVGFVACPQDRVVARADEVAKRLVRDEKVPASDVAVLWLYHNPMRHRSDEVADQVFAGQLVRTNVASFKGMERPVVVLGLDMDPAKTDRRDEVGRNLYTAATRARSHLVVVGDPDVAASYGFSDLAADLEGAD